MLAAGHETTTAPIASGMKALIEHPSALEQLRRNPQRIPNAVEKFLRLDPPLHFMGCFAAGDFEIFGQRIARGDSRLFGLATAVRDPYVFERPDELDIERANARDHMAFSLGIHTCLGATPVRMEARVAFEVLLKRFRSFEILKPSSGRLGLVFQGYMDLMVRGVSARLE